MKKKRSAIIRATTVVLTPILLTLGLLLGLGLVPVVHAASIAVNSTANVVADDGQCTLREAITSANTDAISGGSPGECPAGSGADTIQLQASTYNLSGVDNYWFGPTGLPPITSSITIEGNGAVIDGGGFGFRFFYITTTGQLTLTQLTLQNGFAQGGKGGDGIGGGGGAGLGGAIFNQGALVLDSVTLTGNTAQGGAGGDDDGAGEGAGGGGMGGDGGFSNGTWYGGGGGGGFGGDGGNSTGYGGGGGGGFNAGEDGGDNVGSSGGAGGGASGGAGGNGAPSGGTQGDIAPAIGGGGGGGGGNTTHVGNNGVDGGAGDIGGGGGGGSVQHAIGGAGGFGGGGGGAGGDGDFGGGGGGKGRGDGTGIGGFGGGDGSTSDGWAGGGGGGMGGAIFNYTGTMTITNSTFANNSAQGGDGGNTLAGPASDGGSGLGGALFNLDGTVIINSSTFANNMVDGGAAGTGGTGGGTVGGAEGGGIYSYQDTITTTLLSISNTILANTTAGKTDCYNNAGTVSGANNLIETNAAGANECGTPGFVADPALGPLVDNGARDQNNDPITLALISGSPAIDSGNTSICPATDQRGYPRARTGGDSCDVGAFEMQTFETSNADFSPILNVSNQITNTNVYLTPTTGMPDAISAIHISPVPPSGATVPVADVQWRVNATGRWTEFDMALCYLPGEIGGIPASSLKPYRWDGAAWQLHLGGFTVDTSAGCVRLSDVTQLSKWGLVGDCSFPPAVTDLNIVKSGNDVVLSWTSSASSYEVHRSANDAYFTPDSTSLLGVSTSAAYTDTGTVAAGADYYYVVRAAATCGSDNYVLDPSNRVGVSSYPLNNAGNQYSMIAIPFPDSTITNAASLANHIGAANSLLKWNPIGQTFRFFAPPSTGDNFVVSQGDAIFVNLNNSGLTIATFLGSVNTIQHNLVSGGYNFISMPLQRADLTNASSTAADITSVINMLKWNEVGQTFRFFAPPATGDDFSLKTGDPFLVNLAPGGPANWP